MISLLSRHYLVSGLNEVDTRNAIFKWANAYHYHVKIGVKRVIHDVSVDLSPLRGATRLFINDYDIAFIKNVAKTKLERKIALAILCYAKMNADTDNMIEAPLSTIADWVGQKNPHNMYTRILPKLLQRGFFTNEEDVHKWHGRITKRTRTMRICHTLTNRGKHELIDNDIIGLYNSIKWR
jgi:hypothetical protein